MQNRCILDGLLHFFLNRGYLTSGAVSVKAMEIAIYICIAGTSIAFTYFLVRLKTGERPFNSGTVILHQIPRDLFTTLSGSPPCLKLETFLRMTKIRYQNIYSVKTSKKGKYPWIEFNQKEIADSNFCIRFLQKEFHVDVDWHLEPTGNAIGHSIRTMLEEKNLLVGRMYCSLSPILSWDCRDRALCVYTAQKNSILFA